MPVRVKVAFATLNTSKQQKVHDMKKIQRFLALLAALAGPVLAPNAQAAVLANYRFLADSNSSDTELNSVADAFQYIGADTGRSGSGNAFIRSTVTGTDLAAALADTHYLSFTVTANAGHVLNLSSLTFDFGGTSSSAYLAGMIVQSSAGGFGTGNPVLFNESYSVPAGSSAASYDAGNLLDLSGGAFQGLSSITFQFRFFDNANSINEVDRLDNVVLNGAVLAVPEPSTYTLLVLGVGALFFLRRRHPQKG